MARWPLGGNSDVLGYGSTDGSVVYSPPNSEGDTYSTESDAATEVLGTYTCRSLQGYCYYFASGPNGAIVTRIDSGSGSADGNQSLSITGTGFFHDTTNTDSLVSGYTINYDLDQPSAMHGDSFSMRFVSTDYDATTDIAMQGGGRAINVAAGATSYSAFGGAIGATEANEEYRFSASATLSKLSIRVSVYDSSPTYTVKARKNAGAGNISISVTGTGLFRDTTNSDSYVDGDDFAFQWAHSGSMTTCTVPSFTCQLNTSFSVITGPDITTTTLTRYGNIFGRSALVASEAFFQYKVSEAATYKYLYALVTAHATDNKSLTLRIGGANGNSTVSITGTGVFEDTTNTDSLVTNDLVNLVNPGANGATLFVCDGVWETAAGGTSHTGAAAITGVGTVTPVANRGTYGAVAITGTGTVTPVGSRGTFGASVIAGVGTVTPAGTVIKPGAAVIAGVGTVTPNPKLGAGGAAVIAGVGTVTPNPKLGAAGVAAITGVGTVTAAGFRTAKGVVSITGVGTVAAAGLVGKLGASAITGTGVMTPNPKLLANGAVAIAGVGTVTAAGSAVRKAVAAITGTGTVTPDPKLGAVGAVVIAGTGTVTPTGIAFKQGATVISGVGTVTADPKLAAVGASAITGTGTVTPDPKLLTVGATVITGTGTVTPTAKKGTFGASVIAGVGTVTAAGIAAKLGAAAITGTGTVTPTGFLTVKGSAIITGTGTVTAVGSKGLFGAGVITGIGTVTAAGSTGTFGAAVITGTGTVTATGLVGEAPETGLLWIPSVPDIANVGHNAHV